MKASISKILPLIAMASSVMPAGLDAQAPPGFPGADGPIPRPATVAEIDCTPFAPLKTMRGPDLLTPGKIDTTTFFAAITPAMWAKIKTLGERDPNGLCRYRDENAALPPASASRVVFIGDSITENWGKAATDLFRGEVIDRGISGQTSSQMLARFRQDVIDLHPRVVHIMAGINDLNTPAGSSLTRDNIMSMVDLAMRNHIAVVVGSITPSSRNWLFPTIPTGQRIAEIDAWLRGYAARVGAVYVDYHTPLMAPDLGIRPEYANEGLHPNRNGYAVMTPLARAALAEALGPIRRRR